VSILVAPLVVSFLVVSILVVDESTLVEVAVESVVLVDLLPPQAAKDTDNTTATAPNLIAFFIVNVFLVINI
jgi:hypothetical protein